MQVHFLSQGPLNQTSGGYLYNRYLMAYLREAGVEVTYHSTPDNLDRIDPRAVLVVDSLVVPALAARLLELRTRLVLLLHTVPDTHGMRAPDAAALASLYRRARCVVTGEASLAPLREQAAETDVDIVRIEPGVPPSWRAKATYPDAARRLVCVANYVRGKGVSRLLDVLRQLTGLPWTMTVFGNWRLDPDYSGQLVTKLHRLGLQGRVRLSGPIPHREINACMLRSDLLVHFSRRESYSMATAEAIASRLPVLSYPVGNAETFRKSGLVRHVDPNGASDVGALGDLILEPGAYGRLRPRGAVPTRTTDAVGREFLSMLRSA